KRYSPDLVKDPFQVWFDKNYWITSVIAGVILFAIGGFSMVLWAIFLRVVIGWHSTWLVNSATHLWGKGRFETRDTSRNNVPIAAITWGEGLHNNHHAHPRSARHGLAWYEFDINWVMIRILEKAGLLTNVYAYDIKSKKPAEPDVMELQPVQDAA